VVISTRHHYPLAAACEVTTEPRYATIENLLSAKTEKASMKLIEQHQPDETFYFQATATSPLGPFQRHPKPIMEAVQATVCRSFG
jgi:hypothetical protein